VWGVPDVLKHHRAFIVRVKNSKKKSFVCNGKGYVAVVDESCWMGRESNKTNKGDSGRGLSVSTGRFGVNVEL
jgi:hypothetical protein